MSSQSYRLPRAGVCRVVAIGLAQVLTLVIFILLMRYSIDRLTPGTVGAALTAERHRVYGAIGAMAVAALVHGWLRAAEFSVSEKIGYDVVRDLRMEMYAHLQGMTPRQLQHRARGGLLLRFIGDLSMLRMWISRGLLGGTVAIIVLVGTLVPLTILDPTIGLSVSAVLLGGAAASLTNGKKMRSATRTMRRRRSLVTGNIDEQINALTVVQVFGRAPGELARLSRQNEDLTASLCRVAELRGRLRGIATGSGMLAVVVVLGVGTIEVARGHASIGLVVGALLITRQLNSPVRTIGLAHDYWHRAQVSQQKINDFLRSSSRGLSPEGSSRLRVRRGEVEFCGVTVAGALRDVAVVAPAGECVAITGRSGSGKSSLLFLIARLLDPESGRILIDGQDLQDASASSAAKYIGIVSPDLPLMRGSLYRNVTYAAPDATEEEVRRVVLTSGLGEIIDELPDGLDTWITEGGRNLSAAQRQSIALARAMMNNPPILLLDEPTAGLDGEGKARFHRMLGGHRGTVLLVTSDHDELQLADRVWVLDRGSLVSDMSGDDYRRQQWAERMRGQRWTAHNAS